MEETLTVSWINHHEELVDALWNYFLNKQRLDVEVNCQDHVIEAHQLILGSFSPAVRKIIQDGWTRMYTNERQTLIWDIPREDADLVIEFMYRGEIHITEDKMVGLRKAALDLEFQALLDALNNFNNSRKGAKKRKGKPIKIPNNKLSAELGIDDDISLNKNSGEETDCEKINDLRDDRKPLKFQRMSPKTRRKIGANEKSERRNDKRNEDINGSQLNKDQGDKERRKLAAAERKKRWLAKRPVLHCFECEYETRDKNTFKSHQAKHDPNAERITCDVCSKTFRSRDSFRKHVRGHVNPDKLLKCTHCDFRTVQRSTWVQHLAAIHHVDPQGNPLAANIKCPHCDSAFLTDYRLRIHVVRKHTAIKSHVCPECDYATISKGEMDRHVSRKHRNERPFMCETCGFRSKTRSAFNSHLITHSGLKPYKCDTCGQAYVRKDKLREHLKKHAKEEVNNGLVSSQTTVRCCTFCGLGYYSCNDFTDHLHLCHQGRSEVEGEESNEEDKEQRNPEEKKKADDERTSHAFDAHSENPHLINSVQDTLFANSGCYDQLLSHTEDTDTVLLNYLL